MNGPQTLSVQPKIAGIVHGGQQPVSGATIQLYAASMTADKGASTPLLTTPVTTGSDGSFSITGDYTCPATNPLVYIVSTGGNPGLGGSVNNTDIALMSVMGTCKKLTSSTYVVINELTTVASVQSLAAFMTDYAHVGASPTNPTAIAAAFEQAAGLLNFSTGMFQAGSQLLLPDTLLSTLANVLAACVNTAGGTAGDSSVCGRLLTYSGTTTDTVTAILHMIQSPGNNASQLYGLIGSTPPFQPYFTSVPTDFTAAVGYTVPVAVHTGTLDSNGHIWLATGGYTYDTVADTSTDIQGNITVYDNNFNSIFTVTPGTGGLYYPQSMSPDAAGNVYAVNANNTISKFSSTGSALSPSGGWSIGITTTFTGTGPGNGYVSGTFQAGGIRIDALGNMWGDTSFGATNCYYEMNSSGTNITPSGNFCSMAGSTFFTPDAVDGSGNAWFSGSPSISKVNAAGNLVISAPISQSCFFPTSELAKLPPASQNFDLATLGVQYDHVHNQLWGYSGTGAGAITNAGAALFCDVGPATLPLIPTYGSTSTTPGSPYSAGSLLISSLALDGAGNAWFTTGGVAATGVVGSTAGSFTGTIKYASYLGEISSSGVLLTPYNAGSGIYGLQPAGLGTNATATATETSVSSGSFSSSLLGVDSVGNIWAFDLQTNKLLKITGLATANTVNY